MAKIQSVSVTLASGEALFEDLEQEEFSEDREGSPWIVWLKVPCAWLIYSSSSLIFRGTGVRMLLQMLQFEAA